MGSPAADFPGTPRVAWNTLNLTRSSEDCLSLNVYAPIAPRAGAAAMLPVMVYFHAGEFRFGSSNDRESALPFGNGSVILVTANVRLNIFGFAAHDLLRPRDPKNSTGNYGMQDQRAVLQWVQRSIAAFGGDKTAVTIFGESSGGTSVGYHVVSKASRGLFRRAIMESPGLTQTKTWEAATTNTEWVASAIASTASLGCAWPSSSSDGTAQQALFAPLHGIASHGGKPLAVFNSTALAMAACLARADCFGVYTPPPASASLSADRVAYVYGGGARGNLSHGGSVPFLFNATDKEMPPGGWPAGAEPIFLIRLVSRASLVSCLVHADARDLVFVMLSPPYGDTFMTDSCAPAIDGVELSDTIAALTRDPANFPANLDILAGANLDEGTEFMNSLPPFACNASQATFAEWCTHVFGAELGSSVPQLYLPADLIAPTPLCRPTKKNGDAPTLPTWVAAMRAASDSAITCRVREMLAATAKKGGKAWQYSFRATPIYSANMGSGMPDYMGSFHGSEVPFVFGDRFELSSDGERGLSAGMSCAWVNFAVSGSPNIGSGGRGCDWFQSNGAQWLEFKGGEVDGAMIFANTTSGTKGVAHLKQAQCDLFAKFP